MLHAASSEKSFYDLSIYTLCDKINHKRQMSYGVLSLFRLQKKYAAGLTKKQGRSDGEYIFNNGYGKDAKQ